MTTVSGIRSAADTNYALPVWIIRRRLPWVDKLKRATFLSRCITNRLSFLGAGSAGQDQGWLKSAGLTAAPPWPDTLVQHTNWQSEWVALLGISLQRKRNCYWIGKKHGFSHLKERRLLKKLKHCTETWYSGISGPVVHLIKVCTRFCQIQCTIDYKTLYWASLVAQWLRICLPIHGTRVWALVWEDPTCCRATGPVSHNYWACASGACAPQQERPQ